MIFIFFIVWLVQSALAHLPLSSSGTQPDILPVIFACVMFSLVIASIHLQTLYFKRYGWPCRRKNATTEICIFIADIVLFVGTLAVLIFSAVMAVHDARRFSNPVNNVANYTIPSSNSNDSGISVYPDEINGGYERDFGIKFELASGG